jgi:uncharacterized protein Yka (UPF0111/DUF47 family)
MVPRVYGFSVKDEDAEEIERSLRFLESVFTTRNRSEVITKSIMKLVTLMRKLCLEKRDKFAEFTDEYSILCKEIDELRKVVEHLK